MNIPPTMRQSDSERLAGKIMADIQARTLAPGMWLKQIDIEQRYEATRNVARAALIRLAAQRYIEHEPNRGYRVPAIEGTKRIQLLRVRAILEASLVPEIVARVTDDAIAELRGLAADFTHGVETSGFLELIEINRAFHSRMQMLAQNAEHMRIIQDLRRTLRAYPGMTWDSPAMMRASAEDHHAMVDALEARDIERLMHLTISHIGKGELGSVELAHFNDT